MSFIQFIDDNERIEVPFGDSVVYVRRMPEDEQYAFLRRFTKTRMHQGIKMEETDHPQFNKAVLEWGVRDWKGVKRQNTGEEIPFSPETIRGLPPWVLRNVRAAILSQQEEALDEEEAEKN